MGGDKYIVILSDAQSSLVEDLFCVIDLVGTIFWTNDLRSNIEFAQGVLYLQYYRYIVYMAE